MRRNDGWCGGGHVVEATAHKMPGQKGGELVEARVVGSRLIARYRRAVGLIAVSVRLVTVRLIAPPWSNRKLRAGLIARGRWSNCRLRANLLARSR